jgi:hypothetical protein
MERQVGDEDVGEFRPSRFSLQSLLWQKLEGILSFVACSRHTIQLLGDDCSSGAAQNKELTNWIQDKVALGACFHLSSQSAK